MNDTQESDFDFESEFLEYLNKNGKKHYDIFDETQSEYSDFENELITRISSLVDILIGKMSAARGISLEIHAFCVKDDFINAFCFVTNHHYYIGIHSATFVELIRKTQILSDYLTVSNRWEDYQNKDVGEIQALLWMDSFKMILSHEYMHIILGHCDVICKDSMFLWEVGECEDLSENFSEKEFQAIEMIADEFAAKDAAWQMVSILDDIEKIRYKSLNYYLAILLVFSVFHNYRGEDRRHPSLGIRLHSIISVVDDTIIKELNKTCDRVWTERIETVIDTFMEIVQQFSKLFSYDVVTELGVQEFDKDYLELYNVAADVVKITNSKAVYPIDEFEKIDENILELFDTEREILAYSAQAGMSYDEACELIKKVKTER